MHKNSYNILCILTIEIRYALCYNIIVPRERTLANRMREGNFWATKPQLHKDRKEVFKMTLAMVKNVLNKVDAMTLFDYDSDVEVINYETGAHYRREDNGVITLGGDPIKADENFVLSLPVVCIEPAPHSVLIISVRD